MSSIAPFGGLWLFLGLWLSSTILWGASPILGQWLGSTIWTLVIVFLVVFAVAKGALFAPSGSSGRKHMIWAAVAGLWVCISGPLTLDFLRSIAEHM